MKKVINKTTAKTDMLKPISTSSALSNQLHLQAKRDYSETMIADQADDGIFSRVRIQVGCPRSQLGGPSL